MARWCSDVQLRAIMRAVVADPCSGANWAMLHDRVTDLGLGWPEDWDMVWALGRTYRCLRENTKHWGEGDYRRHKTWLAQHLETLFGRFRGSPRRPP